jgi:ABC-type Fe3+ transport system permease subunit
VNATDALFESLIRSVGIALLAAAAAYPLCAVLGSLRRRWLKRLAWCLVVAPLLTPALMIGYAYWSWSAALVRYPVVNECVYVLLITARLAAVAVLIVYFAPPPLVAPSGMWCARLIRRGWLTQLRFGVRGRVMYAGVAFAITFMLAFGEFEIASLLNVNTWGVWLFDLQAGAPPVSYSMRYAAAPVLCQLLVLAPVLVLICRRRQLPAPPQRKHWAGGRGLRAGGWCCAVVFGAVGSLLPAAIVLGQVLPGVGVLLNRFNLYGEVANSLVMAACASAVVFFAWLAAPPRRRGRGQPIRLAVLALLCVPGLTGSLLLSLAVLAMFQHPWLLPLRDGPLPLLVALSLLILPIAIVLRALIAGLSHNSSIHAAGHLRASSHGALRRAGRRLWWQLRGRAALGAFILLFIWAYFDLCTGVLLRPGQMTLASEPLYNQMHYGQRATLAASLVVFVAAPVLLLGVGAAMHRATRFWVTHD